MEFVIVLAIFVALALFMGVAVVLLLSVIGVGVFAASHANREARQALKRRATTPIAQVAEGDDVKIVGRVKATGAPQIAPLTGRPCAYYSVIVDREHQSTQTSSRREEVIREQGGTSVTIDDGTGEARVDLERVRLVVVNDVVLRSNWMSKPTPQLLAYLDSHGMGELGGRDGPTANLRYREGVLELGEPVAFVGRASFEVVPQGEPQGYRGSPRRVVVTAPPDGELLVTDDPKLF